MISPGHVHQAQEPDWSANAAGAMPAQRDLSGEALAKPEAPGL
jgi:hypothetical protein